MERNREITINYNRPQINFAGRFFTKMDIYAHSHNFTELILVTQGTCAIKTDKKTLIGYTGDIFVIPPNILHNQIENKLVGTSYVGFTHGPSDFELSFRIIPLTNEMYITRWIEDIVDLHQLVYDGKDYSEETSGLLRSILKRLIHIEHHHKTSSIIPPKLRNAMSIIQENITEPITVEELSSAVDLSTSYLHALFKKHMSISPIAYQQKLRMQLARKYLLNPHMTVKQVAMLCGYDDVNFFNRLFKHIYKISPGKWRKQFRDSNNFITDVNIV